MNINNELKLIDELELKNIIYRLYVGNIFHAKIKYGEKVGLDDIAPGYELVKKNGGGKFFNIYEFDSFSDLDPEIREWSANKNGNEYTLADAIIVNNFAQKMLADFYLRFNKPPKPTKIFKNIEAALNWINQLKKEMNF